MCVLQVRTSLVVGSMSNASAILDSCLFCSSALVLLGRNLATKFGAVVRLPKRLGAPLVAGTEAPSIADVPPTPQVPPELTCLRKSFGRLGLINVKLEMKRGL